MSSTQSRPRPNPLGAMDRLRPWLRPVGSLWFAGVLLMLWLVAMASATIFESVHGTERALDAIYMSWWFQLILVLLGINVIAAIVMRLPFHARQTGFFLTHAGMVVVLVGAALTWGVGVDGRVSIVEGDTIDTIAMDEPVLAVSSRADGREASVLLPKRAFDGFEPIDDAQGNEVRLDKIRVETLRYLPDSDWERRVENDNPAPSHAIEIRLGATNGGRPIWVMSGDRMRLGSVEMEYHHVGDRAAYDARVRPDATGEATSEGLVRVELQGTRFDLSLKRALEETIPLGDTGYAFRALRYLPHASVSSGNEMQNVSDRPVNPAIEAEISGPEGAERRFAFAKYPDFRSTRGESQYEAVDVTFVAVPTQRTPAAPIVIWSGPDGSMHVSFAPGEETLDARPISLDEPVESPWDGALLTVVRKFDQARAEWLAVPVEGGREQRTPAVEIRLSTPDSTPVFWLQKYRSRTFTVEGQLYEVIFADRTMPLGFSMKLEDFNLSYYPGSRRPRSYESHVTIIDPDEGPVEGRVISMNHPVEHGGFTFYQSSYQIEPGREMTVLSVSRDPGRPIVFLGYFTIIAGMLVVLWLRMSDRTRIARAATQASRS